MKPLLSACLLALLAATAFPLQAQLSRANKDYELGAYNLAVRSYLELLEKRPANYEAMVRLADSYRYLNQMEEARSWFEKVIREHKLQGEELFQYALVLKALGQYDKAEQWFNAYARSNKDGAEKGSHFAQSCAFARNQQGLSSPYLVSNEYINTNASDFGLAFYGEEVMFSSARSDLQQPGATWTGKANNQLYRARVSGNGFLDAAVPQRSPLRENFVNIGPVAFTPELDEVIYTKNNFIDGTRHVPTGGLELSLYISPVNRGGDWTEEMPFPYNGNGFSTGWPSLSPDGNTLYFASNRPDGFGGFDIYVSYRMGNTWSAPENLGPIVNSAGDEISPFFDGNMLYFSSNWHQGLGGYDIFRAETANGRWARIFHLGNLVNSPRDDYGFVFDSFRNLGYLVSNRPGGRGAEDIYKVFKSADNIVLNIRNASDGQPIPYASVDFINCGEGLFRADAQGTYSFQAVEGLDCNVVIRADGYTDAVFRVSTLGLRQNREHDIMLSRLGEQFQGQVTSYQTRMPVSGVSVMATNQATSTTMESMTGTNGEYTLALAPNASYLIRYSRPGFRDISRTVNTSDGLDGDILGSIAMLPIDAAVSPPPPGTMPRPGVLEEPTAPTEPAAPTVSGFAVQVAALSQPGLDAFSNLTGVGQVYSKVEGGKYKIRVGVFSSRSEANQALSAIKAKGYKEAFLVTEEGVNQGFSPKGGSTMAEPEIAPPARRVGQGSFKVQLAAYKDPRWFDGSAIKGLGPIEDVRRSDGLTVMYLSGFRTVEEAVQAWQAARAAGFNTSFVVREANGAMEKVYP
ncbi:carboxypeptidase regulatory-like domain-containing protein [Phaeodactylibacter luteus]|uniref:SPOR domain-containing protein n=1 Tax=Phaeodactylibacter luteus TaxID=1564516 RepID=A0A5C6RHY0_9BACT|nr:carboxypeptidase regulatory-like domain-containing protein [Phaeodactylibacter luteus]TXB62058.1 hypothetical protein FRY97_15985 [Phaeodactylibacter luteus]